MAWDEVSCKQHKCPCGSGTYTVRLFMDDWHRSEERWEMDCLVCKPQYQLYSYYYYDSGLSCKAHIWVLRTSYEQVQNIQAQLSKAKNDIVDSAKARYMDQWLFYFHDAKTKKEIWRRLTDDGKSYPSLSTFYDHTKCEKPETYLRREFNYDKLPSILTKINIKDEDLEDRLRAIKELEDSLREATSHLMREGYR